MIPRFPRVRGTLVAVVAVLGLLGTGCAQPLDGNPARSTGSASPTGSAAPTGPVPSGPVLTLDGVARRGVEPGCTVFDAGEHGLYLLLGAGGRTPDQKAIPLGVPLRLRGVRVDQFVSYCQQGTPVEIVDVTPR